MNKILLAVFLVFSLSACFFVTEKFKSKIDYSGSAILITPYVFDTREQMHKALKRRGIDVSPKLLGKAIWREWVDQKTGKSIMKPDSIPPCDIYLVKPKRIKGPEMATIGHEMAHCIFGSFHKIK